MSTSTQAIIDEANKLSVSEKIELIDALLASVDEPDAEMGVLWANKAEHRLTAYQTGEIKSVDLNQVLAKYC